MPKGNTRYAMQKTVISNLAAHCHSTHSVTVTVTVPLSSPKEFCIRVVYVTCAMTSRDATTRCPLNTDKPTSQVADRLHRRHAIASNHVRSRSKRLASNASDRRKAFVTRHRRATGLITCATSVSHLHHKPTRQQQLSYVSSISV